jgi:hypothetical protein
MARIPRKPKLIEIEGGHLLTPEQHGEYEAHQAERHRTHPNNSFLAERQALSNLLWKYRGSVRAKEQLQGLWQELRHITSAVTNLTQFPFYDDDNAATRMAGCHVLGRLSVELYLIGKKLSMIEEGIRFEDREKLQDWTARQEAIEGVRWPEKAVLS